MDREKTIGLDLAEAIKRALKPRYPKVMVLFGTVGFTMYNLGTSGEDGRDAVATAKEVLSQFGWEAVLVKYANRPSGRSATVRVRRIGETLPSNKHTLRWQACSFRPIKNGVQLEARLGMARVEHFGLHNYDLFVDATTGESYTTANNVLLFDGVGCYIEHVLEDKLEPKAEAASLPLKYIDLNPVWREMKRWTESRTFYTQARYRSYLRSVIVQQTWKMDPIPTIPWHKLWLKLNKVLAKSKSGSERSFRNHFAKTLNEYVTVYQLMPRSEEYRL